MFIIKYVSHLYQGLGILDLHTSYDYKIYYYLKDKKIQNTAPIILTTHQGLFESLQDNQDLYSKYTIAFFDSEQRYKTHNNRSSKTIDMYYILGILESFLYQLQLEQEIEHTNKPIDIMEAFIKTF